MPHTIAADGTWDPHGPPIEQYYEPILDLIDSLPEDTSIFMIGLSGGGWTTTFCTALSDRIIRGYSVAGDIPLDLREPDEMGDWEQVNLPWSYCELYAMAEGRLLHIFNQFDPCCFAYSGTEEELGTPFAIDSTHQEHKISEWALNYIIDDMELAIVTCNLLQGNLLWDIP
jgi:hypothetical protein